MAAKAIGTQRRRRRGGGEYGCSGGSSLTPSLSIREQERMSTCVFHVPVCFSAPVCAKGMDKHTPGQTAGFNLFLPLGFLTTPGASLLLRPALSWVLMMQREVTPFLPCRSSQAWQANRPQGGVSRDGWNSPEEGPAVAGAIRAYMISISSPQPFRENPTESILLASQWHN